MGQIKKILANELVGGSGYTEIYPITSSQAVYNSDGTTIKDSIETLETKVYEIKNNYNAIVAPSVSDDYDSGYVVGSRWVYGSILYTCLDSSIDAAIWLPVSLGASKNLKINSKYGFDLLYNNTSKIKIDSNITLYSDLYLNGYKLYGNVILQNTNKLAFNNDETNYYMQYLNSTYGIKANSKYGWSFYGNEILSVLFGENGVLIPSHLKSYASISSLSAFGVTEFYNTYNNFDANQTVSYPVAVFGRHGKLGSTHNSEMSIGISRYENVNAYARTQVDFKLAHSTAGYPDITVMSLRSNGNVGFGVTEPTRLLELRKDQNAQTSIWAQNSNNETAAEAAIVAQSASGLIVLYSMPSNYSDSRYANRESIVSTGSNGLQIVNANYIRFQNTLGTDALTVSGGSTWSSGAFYSQGWTGIYGSSPGFIGQGWYVDSTGAMHVKSLEVRESLRVFSLEIEQMKVSTGSQLFTAGVEVAEISTNTIYYEDKGYDRFSIGDILRCQQWNGSTSLDIRKYYQIQVTAVGSISLSGKTVRYITYSNKSGSSTVASGDMVVKVGNTNITYSTVLEVTSRDGGFMQVANGITTTASSFTTKYRVGYVEGLTNIAKGSPAIGYGLWSPDLLIDDTGVYISGTIKAKSGRIGQNYYWNFDPDGNLWSGKLEGDGINMSARYKYIYAGITDDYCAKMYYTSGSDYGFDVIDDGNKTVHLGSGTNFIGPWNFDTTSFYNGSKLTVGLGIELNGTSRYISVASTTNSYVKMYATSSSVYGLDILSAGTTLVHMGSGTNYIGSWNFTSTSLYNGGLSTSGSPGLQLFGSTSSPYTPYLSIHYNTTNYTKMYYNSSSDWGIIGVKSGTTLFQLGNINKISIFNFDSTKLYTDYLQLSNNNITLIETNDLRNPGIFWKYNSTQFASLYSDGPELILSTTGNLGFGLTLTTGYLTLNGLVLTINNITTTVPSILGRIYRDSNGFLKIKI